MDVEVGGQKHWRWMAAFEHGAVLNDLLQCHRNTGAARTFITRLLGKCEVLKAIHTDKL